MNWTVFYSVLAVCGLLAVTASFACMMTSIDFDGWRKSVGWAVLFVAVCIVEAVLIGMAWGTVS